MDSIRIKNLRSLKDTGDIDIKKINVLVGNNSTGKSTFLRVFPLLKQTFNKNINGPILWCGDDDDYVDFGSFNEAINYNTKDNYIKLDFTFQISTNQFEFFYGNRRLNNIGKQKVKFEISIKNDKNQIRDYISEMVFIIENQTIIVSFSEKGKIKKLTVNSEIIELEDLNENIYPYVYEQPIFDISLYKIKENAIKNLNKLFDLEKNEKNNLGIIEDGAAYIFSTKIFNEIVEQNNLTRKIEKLYTNDPENIKNWSFLLVLQYYYSIIANYLKTYFRNVYYIAPVRATAERYYRLRNAAVNEVDCRGKNLPVFLNSLSKEKFDQFKLWTKSNLGFEVEKSTSEGHVSLKIKKEGQKKPVNLSDTGFGYSQILPIITQIWYIATQARKVNRLPILFYDNNISTTIVIEQPELHLHPALQAKLIDIIVMVAQQDNINFIIETHSETMINRIGSCISKNNIKNDDIGILIFEKKDDEDNTTVKKGGYDSEGYLENWPIGFFIPEME